MFKKLHILAVLLLWSSFSAHAEWSKQYDLAYTMGDGDTKGSARQAAIEQIKLKASSEAGTYVDSTTTLKEDGSLTESIQMVSATMVKVLVAKESISVSPAGQAILNLVAVATLDDAELTRRVAALRQDKEKARQMKVLQAENEALREGLKKIRESLAVKADPATVAELLAKQDQTIRKLETNSQTVTQVFSQGTLLQLALKNKDAFEEAKQTLQEELYAPLLKTKVEATVEAVEQHGDSYVAIIRVGWAANQNRAFKVMNKFLVGNGPTEYRPNFEFKLYKNQDGRGKSNLSPKIFQYIAERPIFAKISIAGKEERLPVLFGGAGDSSFYPCLTRATPNYQGELKAGSLCFRNLKTTENDIDGAAHNPIRFYLTKKEAEAATNVTAVMEYYNKDAEDKKLELELEYKKRDEEIKKRDEEIAEAVSRYIQRLQ